MHRETILSQLKDHPQWDVLIIGGGVNGIGTFRDLALQGVRVLLVEKGDFSSGASAASSHMLHGGIRYLENGEFRLVREALHERDLLLKNAAHYARPLPTTIPIFRWFSGILNAPLKFLGILDQPAERGAVIIKLGLMMYDFYTRTNRAMPRHSLKRRNTSLELYPRLNPEIVCTATYYDAFLPYPERLCFDMIRDAERANDKALAVNYLQATGGERETVTLTDQITNKDYVIKPSVVINAGGAWIDFVNQALHEPSRFIGGTKGSHLVLDHDELHRALADNEIFFENDDGRIVLMVPLMNRVMVGTTDIRIENPDEAVCTDDEIDYILDMIDKVFPSIAVNRSQIVYTFSGVRPLPASEDGRTGAISRDHRIRTSPPDDKRAYPIYSLIGGKWTTFRAFSEQAANTALSTLNISRKLTTDAVPIGGGRDYPTSLQERTDWLNTVHRRTELSRDHLEILLERYGTYASEVADFISAENDTTLTRVPDYTRREVQFIVQNEKVFQLDDFFMRRSLLGMLGYAKPEAVLEVANIIAETLGWTDIYKEEQISHFELTLKNRHKV